MARALSAEINRTAGSMVSGYERAVSAGGDRGTSKPSVDSGVDCGAATGAQASSSAQRRSMGKKGCRSNRPAASSMPAVGQKRHSPPAAAAALAPTVPPTAADTTSTNGTRESTVATATDRCASCRPKAPAGPRDLRADLLHVGHHRGQFGRRGAGCAQCTGSVRRGAAGSLRRLGRRSS